MRKVIKIVDCKKENLSPQEAIEAIKEGFTEKGIGFAGVFYEVISKQGHVWVDYTSPTVSPNVTA